MRVWTPEARAAHVALMRSKIHNWQPWTKSTGPRTLAGKQRVRFNALKHGGRCYGARRLRSLFHRHRVWMRYAEYQLRFGYEAAANKLIKLPGDLPFPYTFRS